MAELSQKPIKISSNINILFQIPFEQYHFIQSIGALAQSLVIAFYHLLNKRFQEIITSPRPLSLLFLLSIA